MGLGALEERGLCQADGGVEGRVDGGKEEGRAGDTESDMEADTGPAAAGEADTEPAVAGSSGKSGCMPAECYDNGAVSMVDPESLSARESW